ncbi:hypothetical protein [Phycicoccus sp. Soil748]|uniref:hypothetical protein n=1 Tax=Phycicoccus sp. Soil748 TaxID=1736397 RepID=UPI0007032FDB|nr:hypothetical protein [Phycicoccus sp. Soil748]KRE56165.1 hypothetical protein ASG70_03110 [Phycicoccus sp. Soil748]
MLAGGTLAYPGYVDAALSAARRWTLPELWGPGRVAVDPEPGTLVLRGAMTVAHAAMPQVRAAGS